MIWFWAAWILFLIVSFAIAEAWALATGRTTLSRSVWTWSKAFPLLPFIAGLLAGGLAVHFWWGARFALQQSAAGDDGFMRDDPGRGGVLGAFGTMQLGDNINGPHRR